MTFITIFEVRWYLIVMPDLELLQTNIIQLTTISLVIIKKHAYHGVLDILIAATQVFNGHFDPSNVQNIDFFMKGFHIILWNQKLLHVCMVQVLILK